MCYPVCGMVHIKEPLLLIGKSSLCGGCGFPFSLSEWSLTICLTPYNRRSNVLSASLNKTFLSLSNNSYIRSLIHSLILLISILDDVELEESEEITDTTSARKRNISSKSRVKREEKKLPDGCLCHRTTVAAGALAQYVRFVAEVWVMEKQQQQQ